jgi:glycerophosphoryl diester phosphodiesterase
MFINYAHRGASAYAPENTLYSFYLALWQGANGIETDVRKTKDDVLVLFHDSTLDRVTAGSGRLADYTYDQLLELQVIGGKDNSICDRIVRLEDFLRHFMFRDLAFAIEFKQANIEMDTVDMLERFDASAKVTLTSFDFQNIRTAKRYCPKYRVGYLTSVVDDNVFQMMREIKGEEICPNASTLTKDMVERCHQLGFSVRAWGVSDETLMAKVYGLGVDGMTVNFPDLLRKHIQRPRS